MKRPFPGDPHAIAKGCTCNPLTNEHGAGRKKGRERVFEAEFNCPLHGFYAMIDEDVPERTIH
jgi:hypothetical protein